MVAEIPEALSLGEGPAWDDHRAELTVVDGDRGWLVTWTVGAGRIRPERQLGASVMSIVALGAGGYLRVATDGTLSTSGRVWTRLPIDAGTVLNDSGCDPQGRLWVGSVDDRPRGRKGSVWRVDPDGSAMRALGGFRCANGIGWSPDGRQMYVAESRDRRLYSWRFDPETGPVGSPELVRQFTRSEGKPDGLAVDSGGSVWIAMWDGWAVRRLGPEDGHEVVYPLPVARVTSCCFGGPELNLLFITTATHGLTAQDRVDQPDAGRVFVLEAGVAGLPLARFRPWPVRPDEH